ncbi:transmembrane protein 26-like [Acanthaster planci]|uniref:Transmembrane protein 26-like n=1 Tax=Acanthaster planci TaxID=133434 RepID=A0A8B7XT16_ACAPL|nr:transmembrane protein 26-like [Acanthaster planci]
MNRGKALKASMVRLVFLFHGLVSVFAAVYTTQVSMYWFIAVAAVLSMFEMILTYKLNEKGEWKWFVPSVFIYLTMVIPVVWILEIAMLNFRLNLQDQLGTERCVTRLEDYGCFDETNFTQKAAVVLNQEDVDVYNLRSNFSTTIQQTLMLILILGRWLLPKGQLTRDQLSQLLLVYIGMAADMLEFSSETLRLEKIACSLSIFYAILVVWTWSLMQFTLGLTATKARKRRVAAKVYKSEEEELNKRRYKHSKKVSVFLCGTELWALVTSLAIQDGPYLVVRLYLIFGLGIFDQSTVFFTCKNALLLFLQFYRLSVVLSETNKTHEKSLRIRRRLSHSAGGEDKDAAPHVDELNSVGDVAMAVISGSIVPNGHIQRSQLTNHSSGDDTVPHPPNGIVTTQAELNDLRVGNRSPDGSMRNRKMNGGPKVDANDTDGHSHHTVTFALDDD